MGVCWGVGEGVERMGVCVLGMAVVYCKLNMCVCGLSHSCKFVMYVGGGGG